MRRPAIQLRKVCHLEVIFFETTSQRVVTVSEEVESEPFIRHDSVLNALSNYFYILCSLPS